MLVRAARTKKSSLFPVALDVDADCPQQPEPSEWVLDARLVTSLVAIVLAIFGVAAIAFIGVVTHPHDPIAHAAARPVATQAPLLNYGTDIPTPAVNFPKDLVMEAAP
jgi:hypothetical protein